MTTPAILFGIDLRSSTPIEAVPPDGSYWVHLDRVDDEVRRWTMEDAGIPEAAARALLADETRPRVGYFDTGTLINLRGANLNPEVDEHTVVLRAWIEDGRMITYEKHPIMAVRDVAKRIREKGGSRAPGDVISRIVVRLIERLEPMIDELDDTLYELEDRAINVDTHVDRAELATIQRKLIALRRYLAPQREAMLKLAAGEGHAFAPADLVRLREASNHLSRLLEDLTAANERSIVAQSEQAAQTSEAQNRRLYAFTLVTIIFLPLSFLTGVFGMNVGGLPWVNTGQGFVFVSALMVALAVIAAGWMVWRKWV